MGYRNTYDGPRLTPTPTEKGEWARMAGAAYAAMHNAIGHRYSVAASLPHDATITVEHYDRLMRDYRAWLIDNAWTVEG